MSKRFDMGVTRYDLVSLLLFDHSSARVRVTRPINSSWSRRISLIRSSTKLCPAYVGWTSQHPLLQPLLPAHSRESTNKTSPLQSYADPIRSEDSRTSFRILLLHSSFYIFNTKPLRRINPITDPTDQHYFLFTC